MLKNTSKNSKISPPPLLIDKELQFNELRYQKSAVPDSDVRLRQILLFTGRHQKVLDLGCGTGFFLKMLLTKHSHVWGIDASAAAIKIASKIKNATVVYGNIETGLPYANGQFTVVTAGEIIEHLYDTTYFLQEIHRILTPGGQLVLSTPNVASLGRRLLLLLGKNPLLETSLSPESAGHIRYFTRNSLFELLHQNGFKVTKFTSDVVNFSNSYATLNSPLLAKLFPTFGATLIMTCQKI